MEIHLIHSLNRISTDTPWDDAAQSRLQCIYSCHGLAAHFILALKSDRSGVASFSSQSFLPVDSTQPRWRIQIKPVTPNSSIPLEIEYHWLKAVEADDGKRYFDLLDPDPILPVQPEEPAYLHISLHVTNKLKSVRIPIDIRITETSQFQPETKILQTEIVMEHYAVELPPPSQWLFHLDLWQHPANLARHYGVALWSEEHWRILENYLKALASLGQKVVTAVVSDAPWAGQPGCKMKPEETVPLYEFSLVPLARTRDGRLMADFSILDRYLQLSEKLGIKQELNLIGLLGCWDRGVGGPIEGYRDTVRVRLFDETKDRFEYITTPDEFADYVQLIYAFIRESGWLNRTFLLLDEPKDSEVFHEADALIQKSWIQPQYKIACVHEEFYHSTKNLVKYWVFYLGMFAAMEHPEAIIKEIYAKGGKINWYVCCAPASPNTFIASHPIEARLLPWLATRLKMPGLLRWAAWVWNTQPWRCAVYNPPQWPAGDCFLLYPGKSGMPVFSRRWLALREGIMDFELCRLVRTLKPEDFQHRIDEIASEIYQPQSLKQIQVDNTRKAECYSQNPKAYDEARLKLLKLLSGASESPITHPAEVIT